MDNFKHIEMITYFHNRQLRELIDYSLRSKTEEDYKQKKQLFEKAVKENGFLDNIIFKSNPEEQTAKLKERYEEFMDVVFDNRTISFDNGRMVFDEARRLDFYKNIYSIRELFITIYRGQQSHAAKNNIPNEDVENLFKSEDQLYRSVFLLGLHSAIRDTFLEFVKEMNESKGETTPQINFITNFLRDYISLAGQILNTGLLFENDVFNEVKLKFKTMIDSITGKLGQKNLQEQETYFIKAREVIDKSLFESEKEMMKWYQPLIQETIAFEKQLNANK